MTLRSALLASAMMALPLAAANAQAVDGPYISGGAGINYMQREQLAVSPSVAGAVPKTAMGNGSGNLRSQIGPGLVLAIGWGFGNGLRAEIEGNYRANSNFQNPQGFGGPGTAGGNEQKAGGMFNALYDLVGVVPFVQPYVGVGVGYEAVIEQNLSGSLLATPGFTSKNSTRGAFAYQAILGAALPIATAPGLAVTAEYRFLGLAGNRGYGASPTGAIPATKATLSGDYNHSFLVGLRYAFGAAPLAMPAAMPMSDNGAKTFLVFFDHNKYDLTARSLGIIQDAATYSTKTQYTRIDVDGNADTSGNAGYNQGLSERRAQTVAAQLVADGVPQNAISMHAFGDTKLLVPTGPGVREPQNRRVEIVFH